MVDLSQIATKPTSRDLSKKSIRKQRIEIRSLRKTNRVIKSRSPKTSRRINQRIKTLKRATTKIGIWTWTRNGRGGGREYGGVKINFISRS